MGQRSLHENQDLVPWKAHARLCRCTYTTASLPEYEVYSNGSLQTSTVTRAEYLWFEVSRKASKVALLELAFEVVPSWRSRLSDRVLARMSICWGVKLASCLNPHGMRQIGAGAGAMPSCLALFA
jgi:hypothetical protein